MKPSSQGDPDPPHQQSERHNRHHHQRSTGHSDERLVHGIIRVVERHSTPATSGLAGGNP